MLNRNKRSALAQGYERLRGDNDAAGSVFPSLGRRVSPGPDRPAERPLAERPLDRHQRIQPQPTINRTIAPGQPAPGGRSKEKFVSLPEPELDSLEAEPLKQEVSQSIFEDLEHQQFTPNAPDLRGRITILCIAESLDRPQLAERLRQRGPKFLQQSHPDVLFGQYVTPDGEACGDVFYFDYGVVAIWGLEKHQEQDILRDLVVPCQENPLPSREVEVDEFTYQYTASEKPHIQNDSITIHHRFAGDYRVKLSISHALSQSTKLCVFEERVLEIVQTTRDLPEALATTGKVAISRKEIAKLIGRVFLQRAAVNLLSTVLDTPEYFWSAPDSMQSLYKRVCEYMELDERVEVLNNRYQVLQEMLDMLHEHENQVHAARLEIIVIWLIEESSSTDSSARITLLNAGRNHLSAVDSVEPRPTRVCCSSLATGKGGIGLEWRLSSVGDDPAGWGRSELSRMVKEHVHVETIRRCTAKDFFAIIYEDDTAAKAYHKQIDKDAEARVEPWESGKRTVRFCMPMQLPGVITKIIGTDVIPVEEEQQVERDGDGTVHITSIPHIGVPGGNKFKAVSRISVSNVGRGCKVVTRVTCTAEGPWGLQGMIEGVMIEQSTTSVKQYLDFCVSRCTTLLAEQRLQAGEVDDSPRSDDTTFDHFFDARESFSRTTSMASSVGGVDAVDAVAMMQLLDSLEGRWFGWLCGDGRRLDGVQTWAAVG